MTHRQLAAQARRQEKPDEVAHHNKEARSQLKRVALLYTAERFEPLPQLAYLELANIAAEANDMDEASKELHELTEKFEQGPAVTLAQAKLASYRQRYGEAVALLNRLRDAKDLDPRLQRRIDALRNVVEPRQ